MRPDRGVRLLRMDAGALKREGVAAEYHKSQIRPLVWHQTKQNAVILI